MAFGNFAGGLADSLNQGFSRNQQADFQQKELQLQQQGQLLTQQRFQQAQYMELYQQGIQHMADFFDQWKLANPDGDIKQAAAAMAPTKDNLKLLLKNLGQNPDSIEGLWAGMIAAPSKAETIQAEARAKETPSQVALRQAEAEQKRASADPFGLGNPIGTGVAPPGSNTFQPGEKITGIDVQEQPPTRVAQAATVGQTPEEAKGDAYLASLGNPRLADAVKSVADYRINPTTMLSRFPPQARTQFLGMVQQFATARGQVWDQSKFTEKNREATALGTQEVLFERAANEFNNMIPITLDASKNVPRSKYPSVNAIILAAKEGTGDPNVAAYGASLNSIVNGYASAINPRGQPRVSDKDHAREVLNKYWSQGQIEAALSILQKEVDQAARKSLQQTRQSIYGNESQSKSAPSGGGTSSGNVTKRYKFNPDTGELE